MEQQHDHWIGPHPDAPRPCQLDRLALRTDTLWLAWLDSLGVRICSRRAESDSWRES